MNGKLLNGIKNIYVDSLAYVRIKKDESDHVLLFFQCIYRHNDERIENGYREDGSEISRGEGV